ncbi:TPA: type II secretion system protein, partial [Candidatus Galligastranaerophilus intestinavium]|nr:type II secretion system protein [Candidatus Galligastranaerophilus intestinavium]
MKKQNAFTLAELLVSILIISVILTLLAPVITKRAKESFSVSSSRENESRLYLYDINDSDCTSSTDGTNSLDCVFKVPNNIEEISLVMVSGGGGGAGATNPTVNTNQKLTAANSSIGNSQTKELTITSSMKNIVVSNLIGSGAGGGGASWGSS